MSSLSGRWVSAGVHAVLGDFVNARAGGRCAGGRNDRGGTRLCRWGSLFDGFRDVAWREWRFETACGSSKLRGKCRGKGAACTCKVSSFTRSPAIAERFLCRQRARHWRAHVAALDDLRRALPSRRSARGGFHVGYIFDGQPSETFRSGTFGVMTLARFRSSVATYLIPAASRSSHRWKTSLRGVMNDVGKFVGIRNSATRRHCRDCRAFRFSPRRYRQSFTSASSCARSSALGVL